MMLDNHQVRGGAAIGILNTLEAWESCVVLNLRLWCDGPDGRAQVWAEYRKSLPGTEAKGQCAAFESLVRTITELAPRTLIRHDVSCSCFGADEGVFLHLIRTASAGHLNDAALIASLLVGPAQAEKIALLAGQVGECARRIHARHDDRLGQMPANVVRLH